ncbi:FAD-binding oxidoreductase [Arthrobacter sp. CAL618]|uniref:FAD-binding oxidoreductase n=1 Tax=Arthrobacter sp. CAL618 TaxID=1055770 RepID=UPI000401BC9F|nr:FAD-linked oxidase C-terminal domain-containing protein [Arthrobacter sp. CAL618]
MASADALDSGSLEILRRSLGDKVLFEREEMAPYLRDESVAGPAGNPIAVVLADSTRDVSVALSWANQSSVPVSVRGAGTGLAGGAVAYAGGIVISLAGMNRVLSFSPGNRMVEVQAGVITSDVDDLAAQCGLMYAPDPASYRISTIGGNIATNAGGLRCVKYGVTADSVASVELVLADGSVIDTGTSTRKNVAGLNLTGLVVGSEGTLGVITAARLRLVPRPTGMVRTFRAGFGSVRAAAESVISVMSTNLAPEVLELLDTYSVAAVERNHPGMATMPGQALLLGQFIGPDAEEQVEKLRMQLTEASFWDVSDSDSLLEARRFVSSSLNAQGLRASCDIAVPIDRLADIFDEIEVIALENGVQISTFAHAGDGNLHPGISLLDDSVQSNEVAAHVMSQLAAAAQRLGGTVTGEHGVGSLKVSALDGQISATNRALQRSIKALFDPNGILTPGRGI